MGRPPGQPKTGGRQKGTPNKDSLPWRRLCKLIASDPDAQSALLEACKTDHHLMLKVAEHAHGKPRQSIQTTGTVKGTLIVDSDVAEG